MFLARMTTKHVDGIVHHSRGLCIPGLREHPGYSRLQVRPSVKVQHDYVIETETS